MRFEACMGCTGIGSLSVKDTEEAVDLVLETSIIPYWPQLPKRSFFENMYVQFSEKIPGIVIDEENERVFLDTSKAQKEMEKFLETIIENNPEKFALKKSFASGFFEFVKRKEILKGCYAVKGQITGPISCGLQIVDENRRSILYNEMIFDAMIKNINMIARWQEKTLRTLNPNTIIFIDEPFLASFGSAHISLNREEALEFLKETSRSLSFVGSHCCGNTDWSILIDSGINILSFDSYFYSKNLSLYAEELKSFLDAGGIIAWGAVPSGEEIKNETVNSLLKKLERSMQLLVDKGIDKDTLISQGLITPSCGVGSLERELGIRVLRATKEVSDIMRKKYEVS